MVEIDNLGSGLIGAGIAAGLSIGWQWRDRRERLRAAGRAVLAELRSDGRLVDALMAGVSTGDWPIATTYRSVLADLAALLDMETLETVSLPYHILEATEPIRRAPTSDEHIELDSLRQAIDRAQRALERRLNVERGDAWH